MPKRRLISSHEAQTTPKQITRPCSDCPLSRSSLSGWLGGGTPEEWGDALHSDSRMDCHTLVVEDGSPIQCAGAAIYRRNVCKASRDKDVLILPADRETVFSNRAEFLAHHGSPLKKAL